MIQAIGIDLGTTNSLVAVVGGDGRATVLADPRTGETLLPSVVTFDAAGTPIVGSAAKRHRAARVGATIYSVKRFMGRSSEEARRLAGEFAYTIAEGEDAVARIVTGSGTITPPEVSALLLRELHQRAERALGHAVKKAVITVPAYFDDNQRQATRDAGRLAGLEVIRIINEPTAACLAYGLEKRREGILAVYDLGGGTFDVSILLVEGGIFRVLATAGDTRLGGDDIDEAVARVLVAEAETALGRELAGDPRVMEAARQAAECAKVILSTAGVTEVLLSVAEPRVEYRMHLTRSRLNAIAEPLLQRTAGPCRRALKDAGIEASEVEEVVLVGGSTRMPRVRELVGGLFGKTPRTDINPDEVVALGAAVQADIITGGSRGLLLLDVNPLSLGLETMGGVMSRIIPRNHTIPASIRQEFTTWADNQTGVEIHVLQGERELASDCRSLGRFVLKGLPPRPAGIPRVEVTFTIDVNGILNVSALDRSTGKEQSIDVRPSFGLNEDEILRMLRDSIAHAKDDVESRLVAEARMELEQLLGMVRKQLGPDREPLPEAEETALADALTGAERALVSGDHRSLRAAREALDRASMPLAHRIMDESIAGLLRDRRVDEVG